MRFLTQTHTIEKNDLSKQVVFLVEEGGFEPPKLKATDLQSAPFGHSGTLPYYNVSGAGDGTRTRDLLITNQLLYQLSYASTHGRDDRIRTCGPLVPNQMRYQTALHPVDSFWFPIAKRLTYDNTTIYILQTKKLAK